MFWVGVFTGVEFWLCWVSLFCFGVWLLLDLWALLCGLVVLVLWWVLCVCCG